MDSSIQLEIRRPHAKEHDGIRSLVFTVVNETYGSIWPTTPIHVDEDWGAGWVAVMAGGLAGWMLTQGQWIEDLWISAPFRRRGVGSALLAYAEREIAARGIATAHLHVIASNAQATAFYQHRGWQRLREIPHELLPIPRLEMTKAVR
jgi:GNAT superfamily N-acetyltransferase